MCILMFKVPLNTIQWGVNYAEWNNTDHIHHPQTDQQTHCVVFVCMYVVGGVME